MGAYARAATVGLYTLLSMSCGCAVFHQLPEERQQLFAFAVDQIDHDRPALAARAAWRYLSQGDEEDPRRDRALRLLARSSEALGFRYAASSWYLEIARARRDAELIPEAISGLERAIASGPVDEDAIIDGFLAVEEITGLSPKLQDFVHFYQGLGNLRGGLSSWAKRDFLAIDKGSPYYYRARYVHLVEKVRRLRDRERGDQSAVA
ncbi:MAG: hypothetical protein VYD19_04040, partial [Myxococcota bacterium]|nr:hypothetical protein [Myxococcota bacterium]